MDCICLMQIVLGYFDENMLNRDKKAIAKSFGVGYTYLESWLESISYVRNICAHYGRLYNAKLSKTPILYREYTQSGIGNNRIFGVLFCILQENIITLERIPATVKDGYIYFETMHLSQYGIVAKNNSQKPIRAI